MSGSPTAIKIAKKNIPDALAKLDDFIEKAKKLDCSALNSFTSNSKELFEIVGPKAAEFVKEKSEIEAKLDNLYDNFNKTSEEFEEIKGMTKIIF